GWASAKAEKDIVELAMALEANAYDRYLIMRRMFEKEDSKRVFDFLSEAEKQHLERLTEAFEAIA
ncbi:MAG: ferritin family protein, partial [Desulfoferrobacter sp.]